MTKTAIFITAFNRHKCLNYLLQSLSKIKTDLKFDLYISIDNNGTEEVKSLANNFLWKHGKKNVIVHERKLGLVDHFIWVGDQTKNFENIIFLEDDLLVSPHLFSFVDEIINFYRNDPDVAAASLYNPVINECTGTRFYPIPDSSDVFFLQQPYWGNIWFNDKWQDFKLYLTKYKENKKILPRNVGLWQKSFKKIYIQYLIENKLYVVTPRISLLTNQCVAGLHSSGRTGYFQTFIETQSYSYKLIKASNSIAKYDAFMEIEADSLKHFNPSLCEYDFEVDLNGSKINLSKQYVITSKQSSKSLKTFSPIMKPLESSIIFDVQSSEGIVLCEKNTIINKKSFYFKRRFKDIKNHFNVGVVASIYIFYDALKYTSQALIRKLKN